MDGLLYIAAVMVILVIGFAAALVLARMGAHDAERAWGARDAAPEAPAAPIAEGAVGAKRGAATA